MAPGAPRLLVVVRLSSERARQAVRQDCSFAKEQESRRALLVVVLSESKLMLRQSAAAPATRERFPPDAPV
jgi:hypothetical protein